MPLAVDGEGIYHINIEGIPRIPAIDFIGNDFAIFNDLTDVPFARFPLQLPALLFVVCRQGGGRLRIDLHEHNVQAGSMLVILPEQVVEMVDRTDDLSGSLIAVSRRFVEDVVPSMQQLYPLFLYLRQHPCIPISAEEMDCFSEYHDFLQRKVKQDGHPFRAEVTKGLLTALFYEVYGIFRRYGIDIEATAPKTRREELFENFFRLASQSYKSERKLSYYADRLCVSAKHLSTVIRDVSGRTASEWIDDFVILEAKVLLRSTEMSVQEISNRLNFANQSFFGKYFKQHTGMSPKGYRMQ